MDGINDELQQCAVMKVMCKQCWRSCKIKMENTASRNLGNAQMKAPNSRLLTCLVLCRFRFTYLWVAEGGRK